MSAAPPDSRRLRRQHSLFLLLLLAAVLLAGALSQRHRWQIDLTAAGRHSLGESSQRLLEQLDAPLEIEAWLPPDAALRARVADLFERYRRGAAAAGVDFSLKLRNPETDPTAARELDIARGGEVILRHSGTEQRLQQLSEAAVSGAIARLARGGARRLYFLSGHGERSPLGAGNGDYGRFSAQLGEAGLLLQQLDLASQPRVPDDAAALVLADPRAALFPGERAAIADWLGRGGNLLWLLEPDARVGTELLAELTGVRILPGVVVDAAGQRLGLDSPDFAVVSDYPPGEGEAAPTADLAAPSLLPQAAALTVDARLGWRTQTLLRSGAQSWTERGEIAGALSLDADAGEVAGPLTLGLALQRGEQRVVVLGDADFLGNAWLDNGANAELGRRLLEWLAGDDRLLQIARPEPTDRLLLLSDAQRGLLGGLGLIGLPLLLFATGAWQWRRRRRA